jgi:phosphoribosylglycinamide formyltransferase-1
MKITVLISGRGSNLHALLGAQKDYRVGLVISNNSKAPGLQHAVDGGVPYHVIGVREKPLFEESLQTILSAENPDLIVLAGFMRILSARFVTHFSGKIINIHPSLLPSFPGLHTHRRALEKGVTIHGATVHYVTSEVDNGPIIVQAAVPVFPAKDTEESLAARVLSVEHLILPKAVSWIAQGKINLQNGRIHSTINGDSSFLLSPWENP